MSKKVPTLLTDHKLLIWLANIPERLRWIYTFVIIGGCVFTWVAFLYVPLLWRMHKDKQQIVDNETTRVVLSQQAVQGAKLQKENTEMKKFLENSVVPQSYQIADSVVTLANKVGVVCSSIAPVGDAQSKGRQEKVGKNQVEHIRFPLYEVGMKGAFSNVLQFLDQLQHLPAVHSIKEFACARTEDNKVDVTLTIEVARRTL